jgi:hypothetical protein
MNTPKIPAITIRIWQYKGFFVADAFDETKRFRGDVISFKRDDIDSFVDKWANAAIETIIEDTTEQEVLSHVR